MSWILLSGAVVCSWAMLRTMGAERERRVLELRRAASPPPPAVNPPPPAPHKTVSAWPTKRPPRQAA